MTIEFTSTLNTRTCVNSCDIAMIQESIGEKGKATIIFLRGGFQVITYDVGMYDQIISVLKDDSF